MRLIDADAIPYTMLYKENWMHGTRCEKQGAWKSSIDALPTIEPEQRWIPCSERLPEEDHWLGGSGKQFSDNVLVSIYNSENEDEWVYIAQTIDGEWRIDLPRHCEIVAWIPLPEPYKGEL